MQKVQAVSTSVTSFVAAFSFFMEICASNEINYEKLIIRYNKIVLEMIFLRFWIEIGSLLISSQQVHQPWR